MAERPWYHVHLVTCIGLVLLGGILVWGGFLRNLGVMEEFMPMFCRWPIAVGGSDRQELLLSFLNFPAWIVLLVCTGFVLERWIRGPLLRWHLTSALTLITVFAAMFALRKWELSYSDRLADPRFHIGDRRVFYVPLTNWPFAAAVPIRAALACTIYSAGWLALRGAGWCLRLVGRKRAGGKMPA